MFAVYPLILCCFQILFLSVVLYTPAMALSQGNIVIYGNKLVDLFHPLSAILFKLYSLFFFLVSVTGMNIHISIILCGSICTVYTVLVSSPQYINIYHTSSEICHLKLAGQGGKVLMLLCKCYM